MTGRKGELRAALAGEVGSGRLVVVVRRSGRLDDVRGFVVAVGQRWLLVAAIADGGYPDGHVAIRLRDVEEWRVDATSFESRFARTLPGWPPRVPHDGVDLDSTKGVLRTLTSSEELLGIEQERRAPDVLWIGRRVEVTGGWVYLREVDDGGMWGREPRGYRCRRITKVSSGGRYLTALAVVAGDPPAPTTRGSSARR